MRWVHLRAGPPLSLAPSRYPAHTVQSFKSPPASVLKVLQGLRVALADPASLPRPSELEWKAIRLYMHDLRTFLADIVMLGPREARHPNKAAAMEPFFSDPDFQLKNVTNVSGAAGTVCAWLYQLMDRRLPPLREVLYGDRARGKVSGTELLNVLMADVKLLKRDLGERWKKYEQEREDERMDLEKDHLETEWRVVHSVEYWVR